MSESPSERRRRLINLGELIALAALIVSAAGVWIAWKSSNQDKPTRVVEQHQAVPLTLRASASNDGSALMIVPVDSGHALQSATVTIKAASIDTRTDQRDTHLKSADFLEVERYPDITFKSTVVESAGEQRYRVTGDLTIHGVTKPVVLDVMEEGRTKDPWGGERIGFSATTRIDRRDFGLTWNQLIESGGLVVGNEIRISLEVEASKTAS